MHTLAHTLAHTLNTASRGFLAAAEETAVGVPAWCSRSELWWLSALRADGYEVRKFQKGKDCEYNSNFKNRKPEACTAHGKN